MNPNRSILLHIDSSARSAARVRLARALAEEFDAEVTAQPCMLTALARYPYAMEGAAAAMKLMQALDRECLDKAHAAFIEAAAGSSRLRWTQPLADGPWGFARRALYADLVILGQRDADDPASGELPADFLPTVLVESGRPALILPYAGDFASVGRTVLVAWKETPEAARAVSCAMPWLRRATQVHVVGFGESASDSLQSLERYLAADAKTARPVPDIAALTAAPPIAASREPIAKILIETILVLIPMPRAISGSSTVARMMAPRRVLSMPKNSAKATATAIRIINARYLGNDIPPMTTLVLKGQGASKMKLSPPQV